MAKSSSSRVAARPATCFRLTRFYRSTSAPRSRPATSSRVSPPRAPRPATSPAVCRGLRNCSRPASRRTRRLSRKSRAPSAFGRDYKNKRRISIEPMDKNEETREYLIPKGKAHPSAGRRYRRKRRLHRRRQSGAARHSGDQGHRGTRGLPGQRNPGGLPAAGRADQRQAHRGDCPPDAAEGGDHRPGRNRHDLGRADRQDRVRPDQRQGKGRGQETRHGNAGAARHYQGEPADPLVLLGGLVPGDHPRAHRSRRQRQGGPARRPSRRTSLSAG